MIRDVVNVLRQKYVFYARKIKYAGEDGAYVRITYVIPESHLIETRSAYATGEGSPQRLA